MIQIDKSKTGKDNLIDLIEKSVTSNSDISIEYDGSSIASSGIKQNNSVVDVTIHTNNSEMSTPLVYNRPDISNATKDEAILQFTIEDIISPNFESILRKSISDRLSIPEDNFDVINLTTSPDGTGAFIIHSKPNTETIIGDKSCKIVSRLKRFTINDISGTFGLSVPPKKIDGLSQTYYAPGSDDTEKRTESYIMRKFALNRSFEQQSSDELIKSTELALYSAVGNPLVIKDAPKGAVSNIRILFKEKHMWVYNGTYSIRRILLNTDIPPLSLTVTDKDLVDEFGKLSMQGISTSEMNGEIVTGKYKSIFNQSDILIPVNYEYMGRQIFSFVMYPNEEYAQTELKKSEYIDVLDKIKKDLTFRLNIPIDSYIIEDRISEFKTEDTTVDVSKIYLKIRKDSLIGVNTEVPDFKDSAGITYSVVPILLVFAKRTQCQMLSLRDIIVANNHVGFLEGISDGFTIGDISWWEIDAGYVKDANGNVVWNSETAIGAAGAYSYDDFSNDCFYSYKYDSSGNQTSERIIITRGSGYESVYKISEMKLLDTTIPLYYLPNGDMCGPWNTGKATLGTGVIEPGGSGGGGGGDGGWDYSGVPSSRSPTKIDTTVLKPASNDSYSTLDLALIKNKEINGFDI